MKITRMTTPLLTMLCQSTSLTRTVTAFSAATLRRQLQSSSSSSLALKKRGAGYGAPVQNVGEMVGNTYVCCRAVLWPVRPVRAFLLVLPLSPFDAMVLLPT